MGVRAVVLLGHDTQVELARDNHVHWRGLAAAIKAQPSVEQALIARRRQPWSKTNRVGGSVKMNGCALTGRCHLLGL